MYPAAELADLEHRKTVLRQRIAVTRLRCVTLAGEASRPLQWLDRFLVQWRKISPMAKLALIPLGLLLGKRVAGKRTGLLGRLLALAPLVLRGLRAVRMHQAAAHAR